MLDRSDAEGNREVRYDVHVRRPPPESLRSQYPSMTIHSTGAQTALQRRVSEPRQLGALLHELLSVGLVLTEVHLIRTAVNDQVRADRNPGVRSPSYVGAAGELPAVYEVRVAGELGEPLLRYLRCSHYSVPEQTLLRLSAASLELNRFLRACTDCGATIEGVRRVDPTPQPPPEPRALSNV